MYHRCGDDGNNRGYIESGGRVALGNSDDSGV